MITRAQAEALLTLAEALEACERVGWYVGASMRQGCGIVELSPDEADLDTTLTSVDVRLQLSDLLPIQVPLSDVAPKSIGS